MDNYLRHEISSERIELIAQDHWKHQDVQQFGQQEAFHRGDATHRLCLSTLALSIASAIACIALGASVFKGQHPDTPYDSYEETNDYPHHWTTISVTPVEAEILPLALNAIITVFLDGLGFIHATTLRWALGDRLNFNANLRLFTSSKSCIALSAPANALYALLLILCYTSTSLFFANRPPPEFCETHEGLSDPKGCGNDVHVSPAALYCLGIGLLGQCALVSWQYASVKAPTWSSNPMDTAWAMVTTGARRRVPGRSMMSVHEVVQAAEPRQPRLSQWTIWNCHREARWIMRYIWLSLGIAIAFFGAIEAVIQANVARVENAGGCNGCGTYVGPNWHILPDYGGKGTSTAVIVEQSPSVYIGLFVIIFLITGVVTIALHCAELVTILVRDETTWRHCTSMKPYIARQNSAIRAATSWPYIVLFLLKVVLHWISGKGVGYVYNWGIFLRPPQLLYLAVGMALMAGFATFLCFKRPKGAQPATFGHVQTVLDLVDEWSLLMFWGDKGLREEGDEIRHAGTANVSLPPVLPDALYE